MGSSEKFCLRWNDFESNISVAFRELREEKDFFDVTLACDDSQIQAHKVILSACSPFFRNILRRNPHQHPLLYLKGVKYKDILAVLNFMYMGEVNVAQEELNSFLSVAEDLRVKGLTQNNSRSDKESLLKPESTKHIVKPRNPPERDPIAPLPKRPRPPAPSPRQSAPLQSFHDEDDDIHEVIPVKSEPRDPAPMPLSLASVEQPQQGYYQTQEQSMVEEEGTAVALDESYADESYDYGQYEGYDDGSGMAMGAAGGNKGPNTKMFQDYIAKSDQNSGWQCTICGKESAHKGNLGKHVENVHFPDSFSYNCKYCNQVFNTKNKLHVHVARTHKS